MDESKGLFYARLSKSKNENPHYIHAHTVCWWSGHQRSGISRFAKTEHDGTYCGAFYLSSNVFHHVHWAWSDKGRLK